MIQQHSFDFRRKDFQTADDDHVFQTVDDVEVALLVGFADVT